MFGKRLKTIRKEKGLTLEELATIYNNKFEAGLNKGTLSKYENEKQEPMISVVDNLATLLNVPTDYLLGKTDSKAFPKPNLTQKDERDIAKKLADTLEQLNANDGLMFDGSEMNEDTKELLKISLENALRTAKFVAKEKYTPKKYKND